MTIEQEGRPRAYLQNLPDISDESFMLNKVVIDSSMNDFDVRKNLSWYLGIDPRLDKIFSDIIEGDIDVAETPLTIEVYTTEHKQAPTSEHRPTYTRVVRREGDVLFYPKESETGDWMGPLVKMVEQDGVFDDWKDAKDYYRMSFPFSDHLEKLDRLRTAYPHHADDINECMALVVIKLNIERALNAGPSRRAVANIEDLFAIPTGSPRVPGKYFNERLVLAVLETMAEKDFYFTKKDM